jgi:hypothetical protein
MLLVGLVVLFLLGLAFLLSIQERRAQEEVYKPSPRPKTIPFDFVPVEDHVVPTHASQTNKFNNEIGGKTAAVVGPALPEVVIPSDWYYHPYLPTEFEGPYWPDGGIPPDYIYPGSDPKRPLRRSTIAALG